jgi:hypothetical protein
VPEIGRFISRDPVPGGSANAYDYADADPVNGFDLEGTQAEVPGDRITPKILKILSSIANAIGLTLHLAWNTCVPIDELSLKTNIVNSVFGTSCIPKWRSTPRNSGQLAAAKTEAFQGCLGVNAYLSTGTPMGVWSATALAGAFCGGEGGERSWAYLHVPRRAYY